jgi:hypothetical protein
MSFQSRMNVPTMKAALTTPLNGPNCTVSYLTDAKPNRKTIAQTTSAVSLDALWGRTGMRRVDNITFSKAYLKSCTDFSSVYDWEDLGLSGVQ